MSGADRLLVYGSLAVIIACTLGGIGVAYAAWRRAAHRGFGWWFAVQMLIAAAWFLPLCGFVIGWQRAANEHPPRVVVVVKHIP